MNCFFLHVLSVTQYKYMYIYRKWTSWHFYDCP